MLSNLERTRLENRESEDAKIRAVNDARVKKKLITWLEDAPDALKILQSLPLDKLKDDLSDIDVYRLLTITRYIMWSKKFMAVKGDKESPDGWEAEGYGITRPADITDIGRTVLVEEHVGELHQFVGEKNPVPFAKMVSRIMNDPDIDDVLKITPAMKKGAKRVMESESDYVTGLVEKLKESKEEPPQ